MYKTWRCNGLSMLLNIRNLWLNIALGIFMFALLVFSIGIGTKYIPPDQVLFALFGEGKTLDVFVVQGLRIPRAIIAIVSGGALGLAGLLLQSVTKNSLASPSVFGVVEGAALGAIIFLAYFTDNHLIVDVPIYLLPIATSIGSLLALTTVLLLARFHPGNMLMMILYGIAIATLGKALTTLFMMSNSVYRAVEVSLWLTGDLATVNVDEMWIQLTVFAFLFCILLGFSRILDVLVLNDDAVVSMGANLKVAQYSSIILAALLTACAVSFAGGIGFVGLVAPHLARMIVGQSIRSLIFATLFIGAAIVLVADVFARTFMPILFNNNMEIPTGVFTAVIGAPYFFYLIYQGSKVKK